MPLLSAAMAVLMPTTLPSASSSGPPELPGLIAASVWMRLLRFSLPSAVIERPLADTMPLVTELEYVPERAADGDDELADLERARVAERRRRQAVALDLDDREVGQGVDAVDRAIEDAAVVELDREAVAALDDVAVGEDPAGAVVDDARADAGLGDDAGRGVDVAAGRDAHDGRADRGGDVDGRRVLVDGDRLLVAPTVVPVGPAWTEVGRSRHAGRRRARTVPPEARTADRSDAARSGAEATAPGPAGAARSRG